LAHNEILRPGQNNIRLHLRLFWQLGHQQTIVKHFTLLAGPPLAQATTPLTIAA
jgi:hypothetical protein